VKRFYILGFLVLMAFDTLAQICFKMAAGDALPLEADLAWLLRLFGRPWVYGAILGYIGAFFTWLTLLQRAPIGPAFAATHLQVVSVLLVSAWLFHEPITLTRGLGCLLILAGIVCLGVAETRRQPAAA
jgi:drug/metabolite transporter (DMT)-like permease